MKRKKKVQSFNETVKRLEIEEPLHNRLGYTEWETPRMEVLINYTAEIPYSIDELWPFNKYKDSYKLCANSGTLA